jgi:hypothetical protein
MVLTLGTTTAATTPFMKMAGIATAVARTAGEAARRVAHALYLLQGEIASAVLIVTFVATVIMAFGSPMENDTRHDDQSNDQVRAPAVQ